MDLAQLEFALSMAREDILTLQSKVEGLERLLNVALEAQRKWQDFVVKNQEDEFLHQEQVDDIELLQKWKGRSQFLALKAMLFESADKLGRTKEQMEAEYAHRWKTLLDARFQKLEDSDPSRAARADGRTEAERPEY